MSSGFTPTSAIAAGMVSLTGLTAVAQSPAAHAQASRSAIAASCKITTLRNGDQGALVKAWQWRLDTPKVALDGVFGPATLNATKQFQSTNRLPTNGIVDIATWQMMGSYPGCTSTPAPPAPAGTVTRYVTTDDQYANIRIAPSLTSTILAHAAPHSRVVGTLTGQWLKNSTGYINQGTLSTSSNPSTSNGRLLVSAQCMVPLAWNASHSFEPGYTGKTQRYLDCNALAGLTALENAFNATFGYWAAIDLTYRSYSEQVYWYNKLGYPTAAVPGTSNHGYGLAVDFEEDDLPNTFSWGYPGKKWLEANALNYGFKNPFAYNAPHESYHHNFLG